MLSIPASGVSTSISQYPVLEDQGDVLPIPQFFPALAIYADILSVTESGVPADASSVPGLANTKPVL